SVSLRSRARFLSAAVMLSSILRWRGSAGVAKLVPQLRRLVPRRRRERKAAPSQEEAALIAEGSGWFRRLPIVQPPEERRRILGRDQIGRVVEQAVVQARQGEAHRRRRAEFRQGLALGFRQG